MTELIIAERSQRSPNEKPWWWLTGETYPHRKMLKQYGARFSGRRKAWYYIGWELPAAIRQLVTSKQMAQETEPGSVEADASLQSIVSVPASLPAVAEDKEISSTLLQSIDIEMPDSPPNSKAPAVRIIKPSGFPDEGKPPDLVQSAIQEVSALPMPQLQSTTTPNKKLMRIKQSYCGELTGSISGQVFCYGYAIHDGVCVYLNMGGPRTSVEAIRAKLGKGDIVSLVPEDAPALELTAGEGNSGMYTDYLQTIPEARFTSLILLHDWVTHPNYNGAATTFLLQITEAQAKAKLKQHVAHLVNIPVFDTWIEFLWVAGKAASLLRPTRAGGDIDLLTLSLDETAWTRLITGGVEQKVIQLPAIS